VALEELDLEEIERLDIREAQADRGVERQLLLEQLRLSRDLCNASCVRCHHRGHLGSISANDRLRPIADIRVEGVSSLD
jgi:hypothetical protein